MDWNGLYHAAWLNFLFTGDLFLTNCDVTLGWAAVDRSDKTHGMPIINNTWSCRSNFAGSMNMQKKVYLSICLSALLIASGCADSSHSEECMEGAYACVSNTLKQCDANGTWLERKTCGVQETCSETLGRCVPNSDIHQCQENSFACEGQDLKKCDANGNWVLQRTCAPNEVCQEAKGICVLRTDPGTCQTNTFSCEEKVLKKCNSSGNWQNYQTCGLNERCDAAYGECKRIESSTPCEGNDYCENNAIISCNGGIQETTPCDGKVCKVRSGKAVCEDIVCTEGAVACQDGTAKKTCRGNAWVTETCEGTDVCSDSQKDCVRHVCDAGSKRCANNAVEICENNAWKVHEPCGSEKMCQGNTCVQIQCQNGALRCDNGALQRCENNVFSTINSCTGQLCKETDTTAGCVEKVCTEGTYRCRDNGELQICRDNAWEGLKSCGEKNLCNATLGQCYDCLSGNKCEDNQLFKCENNMWKPKDTCQADRCNATLGQCDACSGDTVTCSGKELKKCEQGRWTTKDTCDSDELCDAVNGVCKSPTVAECTGSGYRCTDDQKLQQCIDGGWATKETCPTGQTCNKDRQQCDECSDAAQSCRDEKHYVCRQGKWALDACTPDQYCDVETQKCVKAECGADGLMCDGAMLSRCTQHKLSPVASCGMEKLCVAKDGAYACQSPGWCNLQYIDDGFDQAYGRILIEAPLESSDIKARLACGDLAQPVHAWASQSAIRQNNCSTCGDNTEFHSYAFDGAAGEYHCTFIFDIGTNSYACLPRIEEGGTVKQDGGTPILLNSDTKLTENQTVTMTVSAYDAYNPTWCNLRWVDKGTKMIYSDIYLGRDEDNNKLSPIYVDPVVYCTAKGAQGKVVSDDPADWTKIEAYQNLLFSEAGNNNLQFMADLGGLSGRYECVFTYKFGSQRFACPTVRDNYDGFPMKDVSNPLAEGYFWGETF